MSIVNGRDPTLVSACERESMFSDGKFFEYTLMLLAKDTFSSGLNVRLAWRLRNLLRPLFDSVAGYGAEKEECALEAVEKALVQEGYDEGNAKHYARRIKDSFSNSIENEIRFEGWKTGAAYYSR